MELLATTGQRSAAGALGTVAILVPVAVAGQVALVLVAVAFLSPATETAVAIAIAVVEPQMWEKTQGLGQAFPVL